MNWEMGCKKKAVVWEAKSPVKKSVRIIYTIHLPLFLFTHLIFAFSPAPVAPHLVSRTCNTALSFFSFSDPMCLSGCRCPQQCSDSSCMFPRSRILFYCSRGTSSCRFSGLSCSWTWSLHGHPIRFCRSGTVHTCAGSISLLLLVPGSCVVTLLSHEVLLHLLLLSSSCSPLWLPFTILDVFLCHCIPPYHRKTFQFSLFYTIFHFPRFFHINTHIYAHPIEGGYHMVTWPFYGAFGGSFGFFRGPTGTLGRSFIRFIRPFYLF